MVHAGARGELLSGPVLGNAGHYDLYVHQEMAFTQESGAQHMLKAGPRGELQERRKQWLHLWAAYHNNLPNSLHFSKFFDLDGTPTKLPTKLHLDLRQSF